MTNRQILEHIPKLKALVVGDVCLDRWCRYDPALADPSRETGIPRTAVVSYEITPGAAGTIANNLKSLGCQVAVMGAIGDDGNGFELRRALRLRGISGEFVFASEEIPTFTYTKLINLRTGVEDLPRVDFVATRPLPSAIEKQLVDLFESAFRGFDVIFVSDQAETAHGGIVTAPLREMMERLAPQFPDKVFLVDSRARIHLFRNVILKPNETEAEAGSTALLGRVDFPAMRAALHAPVLIVTRDARGASLFEARGSTDVPAVGVGTPVDICGAGDSFSAGFGLAHAVTREAKRSAEFGNLIASITIMKPGTGAASPEEVLASSR